MSYQILDVTLRDCASVNNWAFSHSQIECILRALDDNNIDRIEVGYVARPILPDTLGREASCSPASYLTKIAKFLRRSTISVMGRPKELPTTIYSELADCGVSLVRLPTHPSEVLSLAPHIEAIKSTGMQCSINVIFGSQRSLDEVCAAGRSACAEGADFFYVADTISALLPDAVSTLYTSLRSETSIKLGFHAHDSLRSALPNTVAALTKGAAMIDGSLSGMGSGGGNLITELVAAFRTLQGGPRCSPAALARAAGESLRDWVTHNPLQSIEFALIGLLNFNTHQVQELRTEASLRKLSLLDMLDYKFDKSLKSDL